MSTQRKQITEEAVITVLDEQGKPETMIRRNSLGEAQVYRVTPMRFGDFKEFLEDLIKNPNQE